MGIKVKTTKAQFTGYVKERIEAIIEAQINILEYVGAKAYEAQMSTRGSAGVYLSQTGNLQSSTGYAVLYKGEVVKQAGFEPSEGTEQGAAGVVEGKAYLTEIIAELQNTDLALVIVAGMKYAVYVETLHNLNVLTTAELWAEKLLPELLSKLNQ